jgi:ribonuclease P protein component
MTDYAEAHIPTEQSSSREDARLQGSHGNQERPSGAQETPRQGAQTPDASPLLSGRGRGLPKGARLRSPAQFRANYEGGRRFDGSLMTAFVRPNDTGGQRLGITASRKMARSAVERNRAKRLLREAFRQSGEQLGGLTRGYDWVLNARRTLLKVKAASAVQEFQSIVGRVSAVEGETGSGV